MAKTSEMKCPMASNYLGMLTLSPDIWIIFAALAEFERELTRERTMAGLKAAADRGRKGGRPRLMDETKIQLARALHKDKAIAVGEICRTLGVSKGTLYRNLG